MFNEPGSLSGRSRQADDILRWVTGLETMSPLVVVLCGAPGSGKTTSFSASAGSLATNWNARCEGARECHLRLGQLPKL